MYELYPVFTQRDERGRIVEERYNDGWSFTREYDDNYENGTIPAIVHEYINGKLIYHREYDKEILNVRR